MNNDELYHFGILGMKWGVRRYQNDDGTLTEAGKKRYNAGYKKRLGIYAEYPTERQDPKYRVLQNREAAIKALDYYGGPAVAKSKIKSEYGRTALRNTLKMSAASIPLDVLGLYGLELIQDGAIMGLPVAALAGAGVTALTAGWAYTQYRLGSNAKDAINYITDVNQRDYNRVPEEKEKYPKSKG